MRVAAAGGLVLNEELAITGISNEAQALVAAAFHGYAVGQQVFLSGIDGALGDELNYRFYTVVAVPDDGHFRIDIDTAGMAAFTGATGGITRSGDPDPDPDPDPPAVPDPVDPPTPPSTGGGSRPRNPNEQIP